MQANTRIDNHEANLAAHTVAYKAAALFKEHHKLKDGKRYNDPEPIVSTGRPVVHGVIGSTLDFIPLSTLIVGGKLNTKCKGTMKQMTVADIRKLLNTSFTASKDWRVGDTRVSVEKFMNPILEFLFSYRNQVEAYVSIYQDEDTSTDVFGLIIISKNGGFDQLAWEISINDKDLVAPISLRGLFCRN